MGSILLTRSAALWVAVVAAETVAAAVWCWRARRDRVALPIACVAVAAVVLDLAMAAIECRCLEGPRAVVAELVPCAAVRPPRPLAGLLRAWYHVHTALYLAYPAALAAACYRAFRWPPRLTVAPPLAQHHGPPYRTIAVRDRALLPIAHPSSAHVTGPAVVAAWWFVCVAFLAAAYPLPIGWTQPALRVMHSTYVLGGIVATVGAWRALWCWSHRALLLLLTCDVLVLTIGAFARPHVFSSWDVSRAQYLTAWTIAIALGCLGSKASRKIDMAT